MQLSWLGSLNARAGSAARSRRKRPVHEEGGECRLRLLEGGAHGIDSAHAPIVAASYPAHNCRPEAVRGAGAILSLRSARKAAPTARGGPDP